jgi:aspartate aminotransferase
MVTGLSGSEILKVAAEIRAVRETGVDVCDLTVGDFGPKQFRIPAALRAGIEAALERGETNYPPSAGMPVLRASVRALYADRLGVDYPVSSVLITSGSRPGIYGTYLTLVDPGDRVVYSVPSWNNNHYCHLVGGRDVVVACDASTNFLPTRAMLESAVRGARMLVLNSPLNPTGTMFSEEQLAGICDLVVEENARRQGERPLYLLYDQVYWTLTLGSERHVHPVALNAAMAPYTIYVDGISKAFAATGVRVGWVAGPADVMARMSDVLTHIGTWAPRAGQVATAALLADRDATDAANREIVSGLRERTGALAKGLAAMRADGLPVDVIEPQGAIYVCARFALTGRRGADGTVLSTNEDVRRYLLQRAALGVVAFQAFGLREESGWFRLSAGAVSVAEIEAVMPRVRVAIEETIS